MARRGRRRCRGALQFFKMVDAHPEAKTHVRIGHLAFSTTTVTFAPMETVLSRDGEVTLRYWGGTCVLRLDASLRATSLP